MTKDELKAKIDELESEGKSLRSAAQTSRGFMRDQFHRGSDEKFREAGKLRAELEQMDELPCPGQLWKHKNGCVYEVIMLANMTSERWDEYPPTVVYRRLIDQTVWSRPLSRWHGSFVGTEAAK